MSLFKIKFAFPVLVAACAGVTAWVVFLPTEYACVTGFSVSVGEDGTARKDRQDVVSRVNSAIGHMRRPSSIDDLCMRYIQSNPRCSPSCARLYVPRVSVTASPGEPTKWNVEAIARSEDDARALAEFYVENIIRHFDDERTGLKEKIAAWFDQQTYHKRQRKEDISDMEGKRVAALVSAGAKSLLVQKNAFFEIRRIGKVWPLFDCLTRDVLNSPRRDDDGVHTGDD